MTTQRELFLLIGQSNMAGRGPVAAVEPIRDSRIEMFRNGQWMPAEEPLHTDKATAGVGLAMSFSQEVLKGNPSATIGLLPCAVGGTPLSRWMPGGDLYMNAVAVAKQAMAGGQLRAILWHQGENDSTRQPDAESYARRLGESIAALRAELGAGDVPFIAGELGPFLARRSDTTFFRTVNDQLRSLATQAQHYACVSADGLEDMGDILHFSSAAQREFGRRYASEYLRLTGR